MQKNLKTASKQKIDFVIKEIEYTKQNGFISSQLILEFTGQDSNNVIANTLRRVSYDDLPTYAFEYIDIEYNNSKAFDNDYMTVRLRQLPVYDIKNDMFYLHPKYWQDVDYYDKNREKHENEKSIEAIINAYNNTNELMDVTTNDMNYYVDDKETMYPNRHSNEPILLIQLLPNQTFKCHMRASLGTGERDSIWFGCKNCFFELFDEDPNRVIFTIESTGQTPEYEILVKCCKLIKLKLDSIGKEIEHRIKTKEIKMAPTIFIDLVNEDHTIGNLINNALQDHPNIVYSGMLKPDNLVKNIRFKMTCTDDVESPIQPLFEIIEYLKDLFSNLENQFVKLGNI